MFESISAVGRSVGGARLTLITAEVTNLVDPGEKSFDHRSWAPISVARYRTF